MQKKMIGFLFVAAGLTGMVLAGYLFVTGTGDRGNLVEVIFYLVAGGACFFAGINYIYKGLNDFTVNHVPVTAELEEVIPIQQQWRDIQANDSKEEQPEKQLSAMPG